MHNILILKLKIYQKLKVEIVVNLNLRCMYRYLNKKFTKIKSKNYYKFDSHKFAVNLHRLISGWYKQPILLCFSFNIKGRCIKRIKNHCLNDLNQIF